MHSIYNHPCPQNVEKLKFIAEISFKQKEIKFNSFLSFFSTPARYWLNFLLDIFFLQLSSINMRANSTFRVILKCNLFFIITNSFFLRTFRMKMNFFFPPPPLPYFVVCNIHYGDPFNNATNFYFSADVKMMTWLNDTRYFFFFGA